MGQALCAACRGGDFDPPDLRQACPQIMQRRVQELSVRPAAAPGADPGEHRCLPRSALLRHPRGQTLPARVDPTHTSSGRRWRPPSWSVLPLASPAASALPPQRPVLEAHPFALGTIARSTILSSSAASRRFCFRGSIPSLCAPLSTFVRLAAGGKRIRTLGSAAKGEAVRWCVTPVLATLQAVFVFSPSDKNRGYCDGGPRVRIHIPPAASHTNPTIP